MATVLTIAYGMIATSAEELFWTLFSFTNVIFLLPYIINFQAFLKLSRTVSPLSGAYKMPGGSKFGKFICRWEQGILFFTIAVIILGPLFSGSVATSITLVVGTAIVLIVGESLIRFSQKKGKREY